MEKSLLHLTRQHAKKIQSIIEIIKSEANPEKIFLFGTYASKAIPGDKTNRIKDYDFLVVLKDGTFNTSSQSALMENLVVAKEHSVITNIEVRCKHLGYSVKVLAHHVKYINEGLSKPQRFFADIITNGILLYDTGNHPFVKSKRISKDAQKAATQKYFDLWFPNATGFLRQAKYALRHKDYRIGIFLLHQAAECLYTTLLLVFTDYKPKTHNLLKLRNYAKHLSYDIYISIKEKQFYLLQKSYIAARYNEEYEVTEADMRILIRRINKMCKTAKQLCENKLASIAA